ISQPQYWRNVMVRGGYRLVPTMIRRPFYRRVVATYGARRNRSREREDAVRTEIAVPRDHVPRPRGAAAEPGREPGAGYEPAPPRGDLYPFAGRVASR